MKITWLGHAAFLLETSDGRRLITDPYDSGSYDGAVGYEEISTPAEVITVSHNHPDHDGVANLPHQPEKVIREPQPSQFAGFSVSGLETFHDENQGEDRGDNVIFVIEAEGLRVCHLGDLGHILTADQAKKLGKIDVLLIPVGGHFTIDADQASETVTLLQPKVVIPMHYKTEVLGFPIAGVEPFLVGKPNVVIKGSTFIEVTVDNLPEKTEIHVLDHKN